MPQALVGSAAMIWHAIDGVRNESEVVAEVARLAGIDVDVVEADVLAFLQSLAGESLIRERIVSASPPVEQD